VSALVPPLICLVTDRRQLSPQGRVDRQIADLREWLKEAIDVVDLVQIRERDVDAGVLLPLVVDLVRRAAGSRTRVVVNDRLDVACAAAAHGVHLPADGPETGRVRRLRPEGLVGRSIHSFEEALANQDADYLLFGTVFPSESKPEGWAVQGIEALRRTAASSVPPVIAIGGITPERAVRCREAGAGGVAAIRLFLPPPAGLGIREAVRRVREDLVQ